jgi:uncharacterized protein DUF6498
MAGVLRALQILGVNAVPAWGFFDDRWSASSTLVVYWFENVFATLLIAARVVIHRRVTKKRGYFASKTAYNTFLTSFLSSSLLFTAAHGVFIAVIVFLLASTGLPKAADIAHGIAGVSGFLALGLAIDLVNTRNRSFAYMRRLTEHAMGRVIVVHFTILFGMAVAAFTGRMAAVFVVFVILKLMLDLGGQLPDYDPAAAPRWIVFAVAKLSGGKMDFNEYWQKSRAQRAQSAMEAELPM